MGNPAIGSVNRRIFLMGFTEFLPTQLVKSNVKRGMTFLDVGANHGYFSFLASKRVEDVGRVIAFEPIPSVIKLFEDGINKNSSKNIEIHTIALSNDNKIVKMDLDKFKVVDSNEEGEKNYQNGMCPA